MTLFGSYVSFQFLVTQYLQSLAGWTALATALAFLPAGVMVAVLSTRMSAIIGRFGTARVTVLAFAGLVAGYVVFLRVGVQPRLPVGDPARRDADRGRVRPGLLRAQPGRDRRHPDAEQGLAASLFQTSFQVGGAIVLAVVTAVVDAGGASRITSAQATLGAYRPALAVITAGLRARRADRAQRPALRPPSGAAGDGPGARPGAHAAGRGGSGTCPGDRCGPGDGAAALDMEADLITGTAREVEEDCATPLCL